MFNIITKPETTFYTELSQPNPIRWTILLKKKGNLYREKTQKFRCREFFNDAVAKHHGRFYTIYYFNNRLLPSFKNGMYVLVSSIGDMPTFLFNLKTLNEQLRKDLDVEITHETDADELERLILHFPVELLANTYTISVVTMILRISNYGHQFPTWESFFTSYDVWRDGAESSWRGRVRDAVKHMGFALPEKTHGMWWWAGNNYNSSKSSGTAGVLHNNGACAWCGNL
jgi:hypothetical protein